MKDNKLLKLLVSMLIFVGIVACDSYPAQEPVYAPPPPPAPAITANVKNLTRVTNDPTTEWSAKISPNGAALVYGVQTKTGSTYKQSIATTKPSTPGKIHIADDARFPTWLPDNKGIIYTYTGKAKWQLVKTTSHGVGMMFITPTNMGDSDGYPSVSPDGKKVAFSTKISDVWKICVVDINGANFTVYDTGIAPKWSPTGDTLVYYKDEQIQIFDLQTGQITQLTNSKEANYEPVWSPDGNWIAFYRKQGGSENYDLFAMRSDGTALTQLTTGDTLDMRPSWSIDGYIYFQTNAGAPSGDRYSSDIWRLTPVLEHIK